MSLKRKLAIGGLVVVLVAGAGTGAGLAASGHAGSVAPLHHVQLASTTKTGFLRATAGYLGTNVATLGREVKGGRTLASIANATPGRSAHQLAALLASAATARLRYVANRALSNKQAHLLHGWLLRRVTGFLNDTCPLGLAGLGQDLGGCPGMTPSGRLLR